MGSQRHRTTQQGKRASGGPRAAKAAATTPPVAGQVRSIPINQIHVGLNPREHFDAAKLEELMQSIREHGLLQPITVREHEGGYQVIAGERRLRATQLAGQTSIRAIVHNVDDATARELALIENVNRADMLPGETARAYRGLVDGGMSVKALADKMGKSEANIRQHLALTTLRPHTVKAIDEGRLHFGVVPTLAKLSTKGQDEAVERILSQGLNLSRSKAVIQSILNRENQPSMFTASAVATPTRVQLDARTRYDQAMARLTEILSTLDDETVAHVGHIVDSPAREAQRLRLINQQIARMQRTLDTASAARAAA